MNKGGEVSGRRSFSLMRQRLQALTCGMQLSLQRGLLLRSHSQRSTLTARDKSAPSPCEAYVRFPSLTRQKVYLKVSEELRGGPKRAWPAVLFSISVVQVSTDGRVTKTRATQAL
jgi:hypothetical protein